MPAAETIPPNGALPPARRLRVALLVRDQAERQHLLAALQKIDAISTYVLDNIQALTSANFDAMDAVVISHQTLARFRPADTISFLRLCKGARVIIALNSDQLLEASATMKLADGWIFTDINAHHLLDVIELSRQRYSIMPPAVIERLTANKLRIAEYQRLSSLEKAVMDLVADGFSNQEIAEKLSLSPSHTKALVKSALSRLHFQNRTQAAVFVARQVRPEEGKAS